MSACRWAAAVAEANIEVEQVVPAGTGTSRPLRSSAQPAGPRIRSPDLQRSMQPADTSGPVAVAAERAPPVLTPAELLEVASWSSAVESVAEYRRASAGPAFALIVRSLVDGTADDTEHPVAGFR